MADILDIDPLEKFMCMLTGHNGSGKSVLIGSWLKRGSIYFFDYDGRMAAVANWYKQRGLKAGQLQYDTYGPKRIVDQRTGNPKVYNIYDAVMKLKSFIEDGCPHAAIAIDSFTAVTVSAVMYQLYQRQGKENTKDAPSFSKGGLIIPDWDEYKGETVYVTLLLDMCKALAASGVAVFWTAHPITSTKIEAGTKPGEKDSYTKQTRYAAYGNKADSLIPIYFNEIWHLTSRFDWSSSISRRYVWTTPRDEVNAKTALNLPSEIDWTSLKPEDPDFYDILQDLVRQQRREDEVDEPNEQTSEEKQEEKKEENHFGLF